MSRRLTRQTASVVVLFSLVAAGCSQSSQEDNSQRDDDGQVVEGGDVGVFRLREGDCLALPAAVQSTEIEQIDDVTAIPCNEAHDGEVVLVDDLHFTDLEEFPGEDVAVEQSTPACIAALDAYTGTSFESSSFNVIPLVPSEASWEALDDRGLICIGVTLDDTLTDAVDTTSSMRAAG